jgi:hypothetical protein
MAAATKDRDSKVKLSARRLRTFPVAASTIIYKGTLVMLNSAGNAVPAAATGGDGRPIKGIATAKVDNSAGAAGAKKVEVETGVHKLKNDGTQTLVDPTHLGQLCYALDDQTVGKLATTSGPPAGEVEAVESDGVYVKILDEADPEYLLTEETVTSGALSLLKRRSKLSVTGTQAYTLADGLYVGQQKELVCTVAASTPAGTLTPTNLEGTFSTLLFDAVGEGCVLRWNGTDWVPIGPVTATMA